jgi:hypothetical protein
MKSPEHTGFIRRHPRLTLGIAAGTIAVGVLEGIGFASNPTTPVPSRTCETPLAASRLYGRDGNLATQVSGIGYGVAAVVDVPRDALGEVGAYRNPGRGWTRSQMAPFTGDLTLKFTLGGGDVYDAVAEVFPAGSPECKAVPEVVFTGEDPAAYMGQGGDTVFPNPVNVLVQDFSIFGKL